MFPETIVRDKVASPKDFAELTDLVKGEYRVHHEPTTLESLRLTADGTVCSPSGEYRLTRSFWEATAKAIGMPLGYADQISPALFLDNFVQRQAETTAPVTLCRIGDVAVGLVKHGRYPYRPAPTAELLQGVPASLGLELRRATVTYHGVDLEFVRRGLIVEPAVGDVVEIGLSISNSETGGRHLAGSAYTHRLVCKNGAVLANTLGVARWPNDFRMTVHASLAAFHEQTSGLVERLNEIRTLYERSVERTLPDVEAWNLHRRLTYVTSRSSADAMFGMAEDERRELQDTIRNRPRLAPTRPTRWNVYDVHNGITHAAHGREFLVRRDLQEIGGDLVARATTWPPMESLN